MSQTNRAHMCVRFIPIQAFAVAESLGVCLELNVSFDTNHSLKLVGLQVVSQTSMHGSDCWTWVMKLSHLARLMLRSLRWGNSCC